MTKNTVKLNNSLLETVSSLELSEKHQLLEYLEAELFPDDEDITEEIAQIQVARQEYRDGEYITFDRYIAQRENRST